LILKKRKEKKKEREVKKDKQTRKKRQKATKADPNSHQPLRSQIILFYFSKSNI